MLKIKLLYFLAIIALAWLIIAISLYAVIKNQKHKQLVSPEVKLEIPRVLAEEDNPRYAKASFYDRSACGSRLYSSTCKTANGEIFDEQANTFASRTLPFGTLVEFCYRGTCLTARANDRGPFVAGRTFDFTRGLFSRLASLGSGVVRVSWRITK